MNTTTKTLLATLLLFFITTGIMAQEKCEYATVKTSGSAIVFTTSENEEIIQTKLKENEKLLMKKLNELSDKGWEVYAATETPSATIFIAAYHLRKKKN